MATNEVRLMRSTPTHPCQPGLGNRMRFPLCALFFTSGNSAASINFNASCNFAVEL